MFNIEAKIGVNKFFTNKSFELGWNNSEFRIYFPIFEIGIELGWKRLVVSLLFITIILNIDNLSPKRKRPLKFTIWVGNTGSNYNVKENIKYLFSKEFIKNIRNKFDKEYQAKKREAAKSRIEIKENLLMIRPTTFAKNKETEKQIYNFLKELGYSYRTDNRIKKNQFSNAWALEGVDMNTRTLKIGKDIWNDSRFMNFLKENYILSHV